MPFIAGQHWPGDDHAERYQTYVRTRQILRGDHLAAWDAKKAIAGGRFGGNDYGADQRVKEIVESLNADLAIVVNLPRLIERKFASLIVRGVRLASPDEKQQALLDAMLEASGGRKMLHRCAFRLGSYGNAVVTLRRRDDGAVIIDARDPWTWFPKLDGMDSNRATEHVFAWPIERNKEFYLLQEVHTAGRIERIANVLRGSGEREVGPPVTWESLGFDPAVYRDIEETGVDEPLVAVWSNVTDEETIYGDSDLLGNEPMAHEVTARLSQIARILDTHADPKMQGPEKAQRVDPITSRVTFDVRGARYFPRSSSEDPPYEYLTWEAQLDHAFKEFDAAVRMLCLGMEMAPALLGLEEGSGVEKTETLRLRALNTVDAVESKREFATQGIKDTARIGLKLAKVSDPKDVEVGFGDALPLSRSEMVASVKDERLSGLLSIERAVKRLNPEMDEQEVGAEVERLRTEEAGILNPGVA